MYNTKIAELFDEIADMLELDDEDRHFEVRAYRKGALTIGTMQEDIGDIYKKDGMDGLLALPGIGKTMASHIVEYITAGKIKKYEELKKRYPVDFNNLTKIQGMGPKKAIKLYRAIGVRDISTLKKAIETHKIAGLEGFGKKSEEELAKGLQLLEAGSGRMLLGTALPEAEAIRKKLIASGFAERVEIAGSSRRMRETVGDLDILIISDNAEKIMDAVEKLDEVSGVVLRGPTKITVRLRIGLNCDMRVLEKESFGSALQYFTGSKDHGVKVRQIAIKKGYKLSEWGLFDRSGRNVCANKDEAAIYDKLGLDYIEPEMREARGEIELAEQHKLPRLVALADLKGDLHTHTNNSDGGNTIEEMAGYAKGLGLEYIGITDHSKSEYVARGMDDKKFEKHLDNIEKANEKVSGIRILKSAEIDILADGSLDLSNKTMEMMDYRIASIHTSLSMSKEQMTKRIIRAFESGYVNIWAHPTDRLIGEREPISVDLDKVFESAKENNVVMEIDSFPDRLDLNDENIIRARGYGLKFSIDSDSHRTSHMGMLRYGIGTAKRGWVAKDETINTLSCSQLMKLFKK